MPRLQKLGGIAAVLNVVVAIATLAVATVWIGFAAMANPSELVELAIHNPAPLLVQDGLKFVSAAISVVLILALANYLRPHYSAILSLAIGFGFFSTFCLLGNAVLSLYAIAQATTDQSATLFGGQLNTTIGILALLAIGSDGLWFLLTSGVALKSQKLLRRLCYLGIGMGVLSLLPPLGIFVLLLSIVWSAWVGRVLLKEGSTA